MKDAISEAKVSKEAEFTAKEQCVHNETQLNLEEITCKLNFG